MLIFTSLQLEAVVQEMKDAGSFAFHIVDNHDSYLVFKLDSYTTS